MSSNPPTPPTLTTEELLPPVEPPDARFIVQLFVVPAVIVATVFLLVAAINWFTSQKENPIAKAKALQAGNVASWQQALELAQMLQDEAKYPKLKQNTEFVDHLAQMLSLGVAERNQEKSAADMRYFLCRAIGQFHVDDGLEVLLTAAQEDVSLDVRRSAINAIAELSISLAALKPPQMLGSPELIDALSELVGDEEKLIRSETAFTLGVLTASADADPQLIAMLENLLEDIFCDARYNAALALARQGNLLASETIVEILDAEQLTASIEAENSPASQAYKRNMLFRNALVAVGRLQEKNPALKQPSLQAALQHFVKQSPHWDQPATVPKSLVEQAQKLLADSAAPR